MSVGMQTYVREMASRVPHAAPDMRFSVVSNAAIDCGGADFVTISDRDAANVSFGEYFTLPRILQRDADLVHLMSVYAPIGLRAPHVQTIHDLIHLRFPEYFSWKIPLYYRHVTGPSARRARIVITDADATREDLHALLGVRRERVRVVPLGVSDAFRLDDFRRAREAAAARARFDLRQPYILYAGNVRRHKNVETLFKAWSALGVACDLCITSADPLPFDGDRYRSQHGRTVRLGHVEDSSLVSLYAGAAVVVQPSLYEGFGLSVVEAMAAGVPVIVAQTPALLEVAGGAALTFAPADSDALTRALRSALAGGPAIDTLVSLGRERAASFTWERAARMTADVYREALAR